MYHISTCTTRRVEAAHTATLAEGGAGEAREKETETNGEGCYGRSSQGPGGRTKMEGGAGEGGPRKREGEGGGVQGEMGTRGGGKGQRAFTFLSTAITLPSLCEYMHMYSHNVLYM